MILSEKFIKSYYKPTLFSIPLLEGLTGIHRTTLYRWRRKRLVNANEKGDLYTDSLINYILYKSKNKEWSGRRGKRWTEEELKTIDKSQRTANAKRVMLHRLRKKNNDT